jgi:23S rRNA (guanosine2251-2'-O)-methyltransferase
MKPNTDIRDTGVLIYGRHPIADAIRSGKAFEKVMMQQGMRGEAEIEIRQLTKAQGIPLSIVPREKLSKMASGGNHQGFLGILSIIEYQSLDAIVPFIFEKGEIPLLLLLDSVTDVRNFGAIARSAEVMGVHAIVVPQQGTALINAEAMKTSAGALNIIPVCREKNLSAVLDYLGQSGIRVVASDLKAAKKIDAIDFTLPTAIIMGAEDVGVNPALLRRVDETFIIPQVGSTDSLNVSVATGIILYEIVRQRALDI